MFYSGCIHVFATCLTAWHPPNYCVQSWRHSSTVCRRRHRFHVWPWRHVKSRFLYDVIYVHCHPIPWWKQFLTKKVTVRYCSVLTRFVSTPTSRTKRAIRFPVWLRTTDFATASTARATISYILWKIRVEYARPSIYNMYAYLRIHFIIVFQGRHIFLSPQPSHLLVNFLSVFDSIMTLWSQTGDTLKRHENALIVK